MMNRGRNGMVFDAETGGGAGGAAGGGAAAAGTAGNGPVGGTGPVGAAGAGAAAAPVAFAESLPEDIRGEAVFRDIKDLGTLAKGYLHAQKLIGADPNSVLRLPASDDPAAWAAVYGKLGRPEKADGYAFSQPTLPEGLAIDDGLKSGFAAAAHQAGLNTKQADALYQWWNNEMGGRHTAGAAETARQAEAAVAGLRTEWGVAFDQNLAMARQAVDHYGGADLKAELEKTGLGNNPAMAKLFAKLGRNLQEDGVIGRGAEGGNLRSPGEAAQEINALRGDPQFAAAYTSKTHPGHADAVARMAALYAQAYPDSTATVTPGRRVA